MSVQSVYKSVVEDVINNVREVFLDEGVDEHVLQELKQLWESKYMNSRAVESTASSRDQLLSSQFTVLQQQQQQQAHAQQVFPAIDLSQAAQAATVALQPGLQPQQIAQLQGQAITLQQLPQGAQFVLQQIPQGVPGQPLQAQGLALQTTAVAGQPGQLVIQPLTTQQQQQIRMQNKSGSGPVQLDGPNEDTSSDDDDDDDDDNDDDENDNNEGENEDQGEEEDPLNSADDVSDDDSAEVFDTENVVVCQYDKINRARNRWKFHLKDGIMNLNGKDYVFQKASGDAEW